MENFVKDFGSCLKRVSGDDEANIQLMRKFLLLFKGETMPLCWAALASLLTQSQIYLRLLYLLHFSAYFTYYVFD